MAVVRSPEEQSDGEASGFMGDIHACNVALGDVIEACNLNGQKYLDALWDNPSKVADLMRLHRNKLVADGVIE